MADLSFLSTFLFRSLVFALLIFLTRHWELLHLLLVGLAVSCGLFSSRSAAATPTPSDPEDATSRKIDGEMWTSSCCREESDPNPNPTVVVAPLLLPVRSLKATVQDPDTEPNPGGGELTGSDLGWGPDPSVSGVAGFAEGSDQIRDEVESGVVLPASVPWRSRSLTVRARSFRTRRAKRVSSFGPMGIETDNNNTSTTYCTSDVLGSKNGVNMKSSQSLPETTPNQHFTACDLELASHNTGVKELASTEPTKVVFGTQEWKPNSIDTTYYTSDGLVLQNSLHVSSPTMSPTQHITTTRTLELPSEIVFGTREQNQLEAVEKKNMSTGTRKPRKNRQFIIECSDSDWSDFETSKDGTLSSTPEEEEDTNEVDKKADEFIAKFKEQIRLQRMDSVKKSTSLKRGVKRFKEWA